MNTVTIFAILIIFVGLFYYIIKYYQDKDVDDHFVGNKIISLHTRKGYTNNIIVGVYYRRLSKKMVGRFNGYAIAEESNPYDPYAIAIYNDSDIHLGYWPGGDKELHSYILSEGGKVHAYGYLGYNDGMYGQVCVESNKSLVTKRNKPYIPQ